MGLVHGHCRRAIRHQYRSAIEVEQRD
jgi:hypothetical protein